MLKALPACHKRRLNGAEIYELAPQNALFPNFNWYFNGIGCTVRREIIIQCRPEDAIEDLSSWAVIKSCSDLRGGDGNDNGPKFPAV